MQLSQSFPGSAPRKCIWGGFLSLGPCNTWSMSSASATIHESGGKSRGLSAADRQIGRHRPCRSGAARRMHAARDHRARDRADRTARCPHQRGGGDRFRARAENRKRHGQHPWRKPAAVRGADDGEGKLRCRGAADHVRPREVQGQHRRARQRGRPAIEGGGRDHRGQDQCPARSRRPAERQPALWPHQQSARPHPRGGRIERRRGGGGGERDGALRIRQRHRLLDPQPSPFQRHLGAQDQLRAGQSPRPYASDGGRARRS